MKSAFISPFWMLFLVGVPDSALAEGVNANLLSELSMCAVGTRQAFHLISCIDL